MEYSEISATIVRRIHELKMTNIIISPRRFGLDQPIVKTEKTDKPKIIISSSSLIFQQIYELLIEQNDYEGALLSMEKLPKNITENSPEIMVLMAIALQFTGNKPSSTNYIQKFMAWIEGHKDLAWGQVLRMFLMHRLMQNRQAGEFGIKLLEQPSFIAGLSAQEQKLFYFTLSQSIYFTWDQSLEKLTASAINATKYLKLALAIQHDSRFAKLIDYLSLSSLSTIFNEQANPNNQAIEPLKQALGLAQELGLDPEDVCSSWQALIKTKATDEPLPNICPKDTPVAPEIPIEFN